MAKKGSIMRISELERLSGIPRYTIHYYLREGILHPPLKTGRTMAYYDDTHLDRLIEIKHLKRDLRLPAAFLKERFEESSYSSARPYSHHVTASISKERYSHREMRKQAIVNAAIHLFAGKGYHRTNVRDITHAAGISTGTFYLYYPNKRELFIEVVDDVIRSVIGEIADAIRKEKDMIKRTILRARVFFDNYKRYSEILNQLRAEMTSGDRWAQEKVKRIYWDLTQPLMRETREAMDKGLIRDLDPDLLGFLFTGVTETMSLRVGLDDKYTFDQCMAFIFDVLINGLAPSGSAPAYPGSLHEENK